MEGNVNIGTPFYVEVVLKWKMSTSRQKSSISNLKQFLNFIPDYILRYQLAKDLEPHLSDFVKQLEHDMPYLVTFSKTSRHSEM